MCPRGCDSLRSHRGQSRRAGHGRNGHVRRELGQRAQYERTGIHSRVGNGRSRVRDASAPLRSKSRSSVRRVAHGPAARSAARSYGGERGGRAAAARCRAPPPGDVVGLQARASAARSRNSTTADHACAAIVRAHGRRVRLPARMAEIAAEAHVRTHQLSSAAGAAPSASSAADFRRPRPRERRLRFGPSSGRASRRARRGLRQLMVPPPKEARSPSSSPLRQRRSRKSACAVTWMPSNRNGRWPGAVRTGAAATRISPVVLRTGVGSRASACRSKRRPSRRTEPESAVRPSPSPHSMSPALRATRASRTESRTPRPSRTRVSAGERELDEALAERLLDDHVEQGGDRGRARAHAALHRLDGMAGQGASASRRTGAPAGRFGNGASFWIGAAVFGSIAMPGLAASRTAAASTPDPRGSGDRQPDQLQAARGGRPPPRSQTSSVGSK